jgi:phage gpG-like protein
MDIVCISPVDGREVVRRAASSAAEIEAAVAAARKAQAEWKRLAVAERGKILSKAVDAMLAMRAEVGPELAWQMGRPVRYGGNELGGFEERARAMIALAQSALAPIVRSRKPGSSATSRASRSGRAHRRALELPVSHGGQLGGAGADGRECRAAQARRADVAGWRPFSSRDGPSGLPQGLFRTLTLSHDDTTKLIGSGAVDPDLFHRLGGGGKADRASGGRYVRGCRA